LANFSPDGTKVVTGSDTAKIWEAATGDEILTFNGHTSGVIGVNFSPDGTKVVSGSSDDTVKIWELNAIEETISNLNHQTRYYYRTQIYGSN
jgi:WD40 repeat protein